jgi:FkbM family methyltransferase
VRTSIHQIGEHRMHLLRDDPGISRTLARCGTRREQGFMSLVERSVRPGDVAFELGGNIGYVTLRLAKLVGPVGRVIVAEPDPTNAAVLRKNIELNGYANVEVHEVAISDRPGEMTFYRAASSNLGAMAASASATEPIAVRAETVDSLCSADVCPNFYKMDIEGHEVEALAGMHETLERSPSPVRILMELHPETYSDKHSLQREFRELFGLGFHCRYVLSAGLARPRLFRRMGCKPIEVFRQGPWRRGLYDDVSDEGIIALGCRQNREFIPWRLRWTAKIVRAVMLEK